MLATALRAPVTGHVRRHHGEHRSIGGWFPRSAGEFIESWTRETLMKLEGSCHCGAVKFSLESRTPYPYRVCYCPRCRKTAGVGPHIMGEADSLTVVGQDRVGVYVTRSNPQAPGQAPVELRLSFCEICGTHLYLHAPSWPGKVYPWATAIDSPLPKPPETFHVFLGLAASWADVPDGPNHQHFDAAPPESMEEWHRRHGLFEA
jgi:hypothetical protein